MIELDGCRASADELMTQMPPTYHFSGQIPSAYPYHPPACWTIIIRLSILTGDGVGRMPHSNRGILPWNRESEIRLGPTHAHEYAVSSTANGAHTGQRHLGRGWAGRGQLLAAGWLLVGAKTTTAYLSSIYWAVCGFYAAFTFYLRGYNYVVLHLLDFHYS